MENSRKTIKYIKIYKFKNIAAGLWSQGCALTLTNIFFCFAAFESKVMVRLGLGISHPSFESVGFPVVAGFCKTTHDLQEIQRPFGDTSLRTPGHGAALHVGQMFPHLLILS